MNENQATASEIVESLRGEDGKLSLDKIQQLQDCPEGFSPWEPYTQQLETPVKLGESMVVAFEWEAPKGKHMRGVTQLSGFNLDLVAKLTHQPAKVVDELTMEDLARTVRILGLYLLPFLATGNKR